MIKIENWQMVANFDPYKAFEMQTAHLQGNVYGHEEFDDGTFVTTSKIIDLDIQNGRASTGSGSEYLLGQPNLEWMSWLKENGFTKYINELEKLISHILN